MKTARTGMFEFIIAQATLIHNTKPTAKSDPSMPDPRQAALQAMFDSDTSREGVFGCYTEKVAKLVSIMTGLKLAVKTGRKDTLPQFTVAVPISKIAMNHGFQMDKPVICLGIQGHCYNGKENRTDLVLVPDTRKPTDEEFNTFIASLTEEATFAHINNLLGLSQVWA